MLIKFIKCYRKDDLQCNVYKMQLLREILTQFNSNNAKPSLHVMRDGMRRGEIFNNYFNNNNYF